MQFPPRAFIIGSQKSGTTTLAYIINQHPNICLSSPKETHFYSKFWDKGEDWYQSHFSSNPGQTLLDASTSYTMANVLRSKNIAEEDVPKRIQQVRPDAKFVYVLRDPVERTSSSYWHDVRAGVETRDLRDAIESNPGYLATSCYVAQIRAYLEHFDISAFSFVDFRQLTENPIEVAQECIDFFDIESCSVDFELDGPKNQSFQYSPLGSLVRRVLGGEQRMKSLSMAAKKYAPNPLHPLLKKFVAKDVPDLSEADRLWLAELVHPANRELKSLTGFDFKDCQSR